MEARYLVDLEWRICHAVNIYVFRNGRDGEQPVLVHVPPSKKKNMKTVMQVIQERVKYPVGYASHLYKMDGTRIRHPCELEMYCNYVVASNYEKHFKCAEYGRKRSPLLVLNRESKHVRVLKLQNENYQQWLLKKKALGQERPQYIYPSYYTSDNYQAKDLPVGHMGNLNFCELNNCATMPGQETSMPPAKTHSGKKGRKQEFIVNTGLLSTNPDETAFSQGMGGLEGVVGKRHSQKLHSSDIINANTILEDDIEVPQDLTEDTECDLPPEEVQFESQQQLDNSHSDSAIIENENQKPRARPKATESNSRTGKSYEVLVPKNQVQTKSKLLQTKKSLSIPPPPLRYRDTSKGPRNPLTHAKSDSSVTTVTKQRSSIRNQSKPAKVVNSRASSKVLEKGKPLPANPNKNGKELNRNKSKNTVARKNSSKDHIAGKNGESNKPLRQNTTVIDRNSNWGEPCDSNNEQGSHSNHGNIPEAESGPAHYENNNIGYPYPPPQQQRHMNPMLSRYPPGVPSAYRQNGAPIPPPEHNDAYRSRQFVASSLPQLSTFPQSRQSYVYVEGPPHNAMRNQPIAPPQQTYQNHPPALPPGYIAVQWPPRPQIDQRNVQQVYHMGMMHQPKQYGAALVVDANAMKNYFERIPPPGPPVMPALEPEQRRYINPPPPPPMHRTSNTDMYNPRREPNHVHDLGDEESCCEEALESCNDAEVDIAFTDAEGILPPPEYKESSHIGSWKSRDALPNPPATFQDPRPTNPTHTNGGNFTKQSGPENGNSGQQHSYYNDSSLPENYSPRQRDYSPNYSPRVPPPAPPPFNNSNSDYTSERPREPPKAYQPSPRPAENNYPSSNTKSCYEPPRQRNVAIQMGRRATDDIEPRVSEEIIHQRTSEQGHQSNSHGSNNGNLESSRRLDENLPKINSTLTVHRKTSNASTQISQRAKPTSQRTRVVNYNNNSYTHSSRQEINSTPPVQYCGPQHEYSYRALNEQFSPRMTSGAPLSVITIRAPVPLSLQDPTVMSSRSQVDDLGSIPPPSGFQETQCVPKHMEPNGVQQLDPSSYHNTNGNNNVYISNETMHEENLNNNGGYYQ